MSAPGFDIFTIRNFITFFTIFGWAGIAGIHGGLNKIWTIVMAVGFGTAVMFLVAGLFYLIYRLAASGTLNIANALNQVGNVYIPIQANGGNIGKIQITVQGSLREMQAMTDGKEDLPTGTVIKVIKIISDNILLVEKLVN